MGALGVFEADANAGKLSAEAAANQGHEFEKAIDRAIFRAKERFGAYLANAQSKSDLEERWLEVKPQVIKVIAEVTTPTPGVIRRVGRALEPSLSSRAATGKARPSSAKTASEKERRELANAHRDEVVPGSGRAIAPWLPPVEAAAMERDVKRALAADLSNMQKTAWAYDQTTKLYTSNDPMQKFACPGCGTEQDHLGFTHCAGCKRTWNSWPVRQASSEKTSASTYVLMAREIKMRGDQFKMAAAGNVKVAEGPQEPPPGVSQPMPGSMPGDNAGAMGAPLPPEQPPTPMAAAADHDGDADLAGGVTEDSPIDQIQDALQDAIVALKDVQMLSVNPALATMASSKVSKVTALRTAMDRFWGLHKQMNYVAGMLAKEANEAIRTADPRITSEAQFVQGYEAASRNEPLPAKTGRAWLEGYVAFHKQADSYDTGADIGQLTVPTGQDETTAGNEGSTFPVTESTDENRGDAGPFDTSQPAQQEFARQIDRQNAAGDADRGQGSSGSIQPTGARKTPKARG